MTWPSSAPAPAGLAASVYAGSEGLSAITLDCRAFGGQAGASARIENYLGFPTGITGQALMARAYNQAQKFGVEMAIPDEVESLTPGAHGEPIRLKLTSGEMVQACTVVLASGVRYRRLEAPGMEDFEGRLGALLGFGDGAHALRRPGNRPGWRLATPPARRWSIWRRRRGRSGWWCADLGSRRPCRAI